MKFYRANCIAISIKIVFMFKLKVIAAMFFISLSSFVSLHKYYVSVTDVEYANDAKSLQIISRLFIDDFEKTLQERYVDSLKLDEEVSDTYIKKYFSKKLVIKVNGIEQQLTFIGKEIDNDMVHCYFEIENISEIKSVNIKNQLLFDSYNSQQNITHLNIKNKKKSFLFIKDNFSGLLKL